MVNQGFIVILLAFILFSCTTENQLNELYVTSEYEIPDYENQQWVNSKPLSIGGLLGQGNVVLVDFWTYTCVNCIRTFPFLSEWHDKYSDRGLVIIGVHTPEFEFEKKLQNIESSIKKNKLDYPIVLDNEFIIWDEFNNRYWPAKYLFDSEGKVLYKHFGEGGYVETENEIRKLLEIQGEDLDNITIGQIDNQDIDDSVFGGFYGDSSTIDSANSAGEKPFYEMTRELYMGYERNLSYGGLYVGNLDYYDQVDKVHSYIDDYDYAHNRFYLSGTWYAGAEFISWNSNTPSSNEYLSFKFRAKSVNGVFSSMAISKQGVKVLVKLDDKYLTKEQAGIDVQINSNMESFIIVSDPKMYSVLILPEYGEHVVSFLPQREEFSAFAFTFGSYEEGY